MGNNTDSSHDQRLRSFQFSVRTILIATALIAVLLGWWIDTPRRTARNFRTNLIAGNLGAANSILTEPGKFSTYEGTGGFWLSTSSGGVAYGTRESWADSSINYQPCSPLDLLKRRRTVIVTGIRPNDDDVTFEISGYSITAIANIRPWLYNTPAK